MSGYPPKRQERGIDMAKSEGIKLIANNKKAYHEYFIDEKYEAGRSKISSHGKMQYQRIFCNNKQQRGNPH